MQLLEVVGTCNRNDGFCTTTVYALTGYDGTQVTVEGSPPPCQVLSSELEGAHLHGKDLITAAKELCDIVQRRDFRWEDPPEGDYAGLRCSGLETVHLHSGRDPWTVALSGIPSHRLTLHESIPVGSDGDVRYTKAYVRVTMSVTVEVHDRAGVFLEDAQLSLDWPLRSHRQLNLRRCRSVVHRPWDAMEDAWARIEDALYAEVVDALEGAGLPSGVSEMIAGAWGAVTLQQRQRQQLHAANARRHRSAIRHLRQPHWRRQRHAV